MTAQQLLEQLGELSEIELRYEVCVATVPEVSDFERFGYTAPDGTLKYLKSAPSPADLANDAELVEPLNMVWSDPLGGELYLLGGVT